YFPERLYLPYFGIGMGVLVLALESVGSFAGRLVTPLALALAATTIVAGLRLPGAHTLPPPDFSKRFAVFETLKKRPLLVLANPNEAKQVPRLYRYYLGEASDAPYEE